MFFLVIGCIGFIFLYIFEINKIIFFSRYFNICFVLGCVLLAVSTVGLLLSDPNTFAVSISLQIFFGLLSSISFLLMLYALFFALPFSKTYIVIEKGNAAVDTGMYALCRHPGVIWFFFFYLFLFLASGKMMIMWSGITWTAMDIIHVYVQDRWLFPKALDGYDNYKIKVPFLIPKFFINNKRILK